MQPNHATLAYSAENEENVDVYGSLRIVIYYADSGGNLDSLSVRNYVSTFGQKSHWGLHDYLQAFVLLEYGLDEDNLNDFRRTPFFDRRLLVTGARGEFGSLSYGSRTLLFNTLVRSAYFNDFLDEIRNWFDINEYWTLSGFFHQALDGFDIYTGRSSGIVKLKDSEKEKDVRALTTCIVRKTSQLRYISTVSLRQTVARVVDVSKSASGLIFKTALYLRVLSYICV